MAANFRPGCRSCQDDNRVRHRSGLVLVRPARLQLLNLVWTKFGLLLGRIVNPLVTGLLFFLIVTPAALVSRLLGKDPLSLARDAEALSYWIPRRPPGPPPETMVNQF